MSLEWTKLEHDMFLRAINLYGTNDWNQISSFVVTRNPKQCYSYASHGFHRPNFNWTIEEYDMFISKAPIKWRLSSKWKKDEVRMKLLPQYRSCYELMSSKQNSSSDSDKNNAKRQKIASASAPAATPAPDSGGAIVPTTSPTTDTATNATITTTTTTTTTNTTTSTETILLPELLKRFFSQQLTNQAMKHVQELNAMDQQLAVDDELHSIVQEVYMAVDSVTKSIVNKFHKQKQYNNESGNGNGSGIGSSVSNSNSNSDSNSDSDFIVSSSSGDNDDGCYRGDSGSGGRSSGRDFVEDENEGFDEIDNDDDNDDGGHSADEGDDVLVF